MLSIKSSPKFCRLVKGYHTFCPAEYNGKLASWLAENLENRSACVDSFYKCIKCVKLRFS